MSVETEKTSVQIVADDSASAAYDAGCKCLEDALPAMSSSVAEPSVSERAKTAEKEVTQRSAEQQAQPTGQEGEQLKVRPSTILMAELLSFERDAPRMPVDRTWELINQIPEGFSQTACAALKAAIRDYPKGVTVNDAGHFAVRQRDGGMQVYMPNGDSVTVNAKGGLRNVSGNFDIWPNRFGVKVQHPGTGSGVFFPAGAPASGESYQRRLSGPLIPAPRPNLNRNIR